jgi:hypothetical protein
MFRKLPDGLEIYFTWPRGTARVVPNQLVKSQIKLRDSIGLAQFGVMSVIAALKVHSIPIGLLFLITFVAWFVERRRYLSKLPKVSLEVTSTSPDERSAEPTTHTGPIRSVHLTSAQADEAYIADRHSIVGVFLIALGAPMTAFMSYLAIVDTEVPLIFKLAIITCALVMTYAGSRILIGKMTRRSDKRHRRRKDAI